MILRSTMTYGAETRELKSRTIFKLNSTEMDFWKRLSLEFQKRQNKKHTLHKKNKQLKWYCHIKILTEDRFPPKILERVPSGRR
mgnify:CR=1 FL=1